MQSNMVRVLLSLGLLFPAAFRLFDAYKFGKTSKLGAWLSLPAFVLLGSLFWSDRLQRPLALGAGLFLLAAILAERAHKKNDRARRETREKPARTCTKPSSVNNDLVAYCGLYCGACSFKMAHDESEPLHVTSMPSKYDEQKDKPLQFCPGCRLDNQCGDCAIRECAIGKHVTHCGQCSSFPCEKLSAFGGDSVPHHGECINNLHELGETGTPDWLEKQQKRWTCECGARLSWYLKECPRCGRHSAGGYNATTDRD